MICMVSIQSKYEIQLMREAGKIVAACHEALGGFIRPGITTFQIDEFVESFIRRHNMDPAQKGYNGYPFASCTSVNDEICHGFPSKYRLQDGDIITVDMVVLHKGLHADSAWSYAVGNITSEAQHLLDITKNALFLGIKEASLGNQLYCIGRAIQTYIEEQNLSVIREFTGHGIGRHIHETPPSILHFAAPRDPGQRLRLKTGMTITVEPMISLGSYEVIHDDNGWTGRTADGSLCAQYEHTIAITENGPEILTVI